MLIIKVFEDDMIFVISNMKKSRIRLCDVMDISMINLAVMN